MKLSEMGRGHTVWVKHLKPESQSAVMITFQVFNHMGQHIGHGYLIWKDGITREPSLFTHDGEPLPEDWYTLIAESQHLVIAPEGIQ